MAAKREEITPKVFDQEYQTQPAYESTSYLDRDDLIACIDAALEPRDWTNADANIDLTKAQVVAGWDLGKKAHPAHVTFDAIWWRQEVNKDGEEEPVLYSKQLASIWFDGVEYSDQLETVKQAADNLRCQAIGYDNTRGELEGFVEKGMLDDRFHPVVLQTKVRNAMAAEINSMVSKPGKDVDPATGKQVRRMRLLEDERQFTQLLLVDNQLQAQATPEGHGESFWTRGLMLKMTQHQVGSYDLDEGHEEEERAKRIERYRRGRRDDDSGPITKGLTGERF
jgi:hypothetical protein